MENHRAKENAGFTLVELLIAVVILAVIAVPLGHAFITSAKTNAKARKIAQATTVAQNAMEEIQASETTDFITNKNKKIEAINEMTGEKYYKYRYTFSDTTVEGITYETIAEFSPNAYSEDDITRYNENEIPQISDMNDLENVSYVQEVSLDHKMAASFLGNTDRVEREMSREIVVDITADGDNQAVELEISYGWNGDTKYAFAQKQCIYSNSSSSNQLNNIFLYIQPLPGMGTGRERVLICNQDCIPINVYLIRQGAGPRGAETYKQEVDVLEKNRSDADYFATGVNASSAPVEVKTHIRTNLPWRTVTEDGVTKQPQMILKYGTIDGNFGSSKSILTGGSMRECTAEELTGISDLTASDSIDRVYKVTVKVYEKGSDKSTTEPLASIRGTKKE